MNRQIGKKLRRPSRAWLVNQNTFLAYDDLHEDVLAFAKQMAEESGTKLNKSAAVRALLEEGLAQHSRRKLNNYREAPRKSKAPDTQIPHLLQRQARDLPQAAE